MPPLSSADWKNGCGFMEVMRPFEQVTKIVEGETYEMITL
jgi:hypothetical protein